MYIVVSKKKWFRDENSHWNDRVRNYEGLEDAITSSDMQKVKRIACRLCLHYLKSTIPEDIFLGFSGIVLHFGLFELEEAVKLFIDIHQHFLAQNKLRWIDYIFVGNTTNIGNFRVLLDIEGAKNIVYNTYIEEDFTHIDKGDDLELSIAKLGVTYLKYHAAEDYNLLDEQETDCLPIDDMVDLDKEAQIELANKLSISNLKSEYLEAMDKWKIACKDLKLGGYKCEVDNHPAYTKWQGMLNRAYGASSSKWYDNVTVSESFKHYPIFKQWYLTQYLEEGWELDKDLLFKGNKVYCASRCCFLPKEINSALAINRSLIPMLAEKYRKVLNNDIYKALLLFTVN